MKFKRLIAEYNDPYLGMVVRDNTTYQTGEIIAIDEFNLTFTVQWDDTNEEQEMGYRAMMGDFPDVSPM